PARFVPPSRWAPPGEADPYSRRDGDAPMMQLVCRVRDDGRCDVWARMNHVAADGVPMQEVLTRLEAAWPAPEPVVYPTPEAFAPFGAPRPAPGGRPGLAEATFFADFSALLSWRRAVNASLPAGETMTISAALLWRLSQQPEFRRLHFGTTVETGEADGLPRGVGVNVVHPARYGGLQGERAVAAYVRDFNRRLWRNRRRAGQGTRTLDAAALLPARYSTPLLLFALSRTRSAIGTMALTMLKDAKVFWTPIAQAGHDDGFIAIGSIALPTADGRRVGCVSIKGPAERIARHTPLIARAIDG
ncbi:MAG: hypothetical protein K2Q09_03130, partial [Phycisphaerales bacterium]|nr:hypothetical protein [Phycisphaerales bacterium]